MEGSTHAQSLREQAELYYSLLSELRTPILELKLLSEQNKDQASLAVAAQTLKLFDGFLYLQEQYASGQQLELMPSSIISSTEDVLHELDTYAKTVNVRLLAKTRRSKGSAALCKPAYQYAVYGLLHSAITGLSDEGGELHINVGGTDPQLKVYAAGLDLRAAKTSTGLRQVLLPRNSGQDTGLVLAGQLFELMGSGLTHTKNQFGQSVGVRFKSVQQMSLIDSLA